MDHDQNEMTLVPADSPLLMENTTVEGEPTYAPTDHHRAASGPSPPSLPQQLQRANKRNY